MLPFIEQLIRRTPGLKGVVLERDRLRDELALLQRKMPFPLGHFYSPLHDPDELRAGELRDPGPDREGRPPQAIDLHQAGQLRLFDEFARYYDEQPFPEEKRPGSRYYFRNDFFSYGDALTLYSMMRHARPARIIEVGSGFSSAAMLDTDERFLDRSVEFTFVEPYPDRLKSVLGEGDSGSLARILERPVQGLDLDLFDELKAGDFLFIDSSHVAKFHSDVNFLFFEVLPRLFAGVLVHIHDIFYPFEYPDDWLLEGRAWNESYLLRAFLMYNPAFRVVWFSSFLRRFHEAKFAARMPMFLKNSGASLWLQKVAPPVPA